MTPMAERPPVLAEPAPPASLPHSGRHVWPQQLVAQRCPAGQSALDAQSATTSQNSLFQQKHLPSVSTSHTHGPRSAGAPHSVISSPQFQSRQRPGTQPGAGDSCAAARLPMLVIAGAAHAIAAPAPIRLIMLRREICDASNSWSTGHPPIGRMERPDRGRPGGMPHRPRSVVLPTHHRQGPVPHHDDPTARSTTPSALVGTARLRMARTASSRSLHTIR